MHPHYWVVFSQQNKNLAIVPCRFLIGAQQSLPCMCKAKSASLTLQISIQSKELCKWQLSLFCLALIPAFSDIDMGSLLALPFVAKSVTQLQSIPRGQYLLTISDERMGPPSWEVCTFRSVWGFNSN